ncbi:MAG: hypothetical protein HY298_27750 [Verrucomicrobia bacterium]|nr:hypothetical protein [Verrucomicrobiota bacterium]
MKPNKPNEYRANAEIRTTVKSACLASCQKILAQIKKAKEAIFAESRDALATQERLVRLALNEAEALAWQTMYPNLVFPTLAMEKVQGLAVWNAHQQSVRQTNRPSAFAAQQIGNVRGY